MVATAVANYTMDGVFGGRGVDCAWLDMAVRKNSGSHIDASHSRQPLVKGERLVRYEVNAVIPFWCGRMCLLLLNMWLWLGKVF